MEYHEQDEITLKEIILKIIGYAKEVLSYWKILVLAGIIGGVIMAVRAYMTPYYYHEKLTFMMDDSGGEATIPGLELLGDLFGSGGGSQDNLDKILQLFASNKIINNTLFTKIDIEGKQDYLANHFLEKYTPTYLAEEYERFGFYYSPDWMVQLMGQDEFRFSHDSIPAFTDKENLFLRLLNERINGDFAGIVPKRLDSEMDQNSGIMTLKMHSEHPELTLGVLNNIYNELSQFFVEKATEKQQKTYNIMRDKRDSVITELKAMEYQLANFKDSNRNLVTVKGYLKQLRLEREVAILNVMYAEVIKQLEATDFALKNKTPVVQIIDLPRTPILPTISSWKRAFLFGFILTIILGSIVLVIRTIILEIIE